MFRSLFVAALLLMMTIRVHAQPPLDGLGDSLLPNAGNGGYDVQHYTLDIVVASVEDAALEATTTIDLLATQDLDNFYFDFTSLDIASITVAGEAADFEFKRGELAVIPANPLEAGQAYTVVVNYSGDPAQVMNPMIGAGGWNEYSGGIYVAGEPLSASSFFPVNEHPRDKATYTIRMTIPEPYVAVSNGVLTETLASGDLTTYVYEMAQPMASYLITIGIGQYDVIEQEGPNGLPITVYYPEGISRRLMRAFDAQPEMIAFFNDTFGPYPFDTYGGLVIDDVRMGYALETQSLSIYAIDMIRYGGERVVVHELAHQWFGNSVSLYQWQDIWLNEGFASYAEALWAEHQEGRQAYERILSEYYLTTRFTDVLPGSPSLNSLFDGAIYHRGALTLHALRFREGDDIFFNILRTYAERFRYGNATTEDFIAIAEELSDKPLDDLFDVWLYGDEVPPPHTVGLRWGS
jgi:aminopeptidase N